MASWNQTNMILLIIDTLQFAKFAKSLAPLTLPRR